MKLLFGLLVCLAISSALALPARSPKDEIDLVQVPRGPQRSDADANDETDVDPNFKNFDGFVDTGAGYPFLAPLPRPFSFNLGFFDSFDDIFRRLRTRLWSVDTDDESSEEGGFGLRGLDAAKGANTTSVVKVVDGHKIEINDTVIGNGDGSNGGAVFKFRIINIRPLESGEEVPEGTQAPTTEIQNRTPVRDIEGNSDENKNSSEENEINANVNDPESTTETETITTEMYDTIPQALPSSDNNTIDNDSPVSRDELQVDNIEGNASATEGVPTTEEIESLNDEVVGAFDEETTKPDGNTKKSEKLSELVEPENVNDGGSDEAEDSTKPTEDMAEDESNESVDVNQKVEEIEALTELIEESQGLKESLVEKEIEQMEDQVDDKLTKVENDEEKRLALEVEKMISTIDKTGLREDISSSDDEEDNEDVNSVNNQGLNSEWGNLDDKNILTNEIDVYQSVPIDLSNDIAINDIMADQGAPIDPDAEVFNVEEFDVGKGDALIERQFEALTDIK